MGSVTLFTLALVAVFSVAFAQIVSYNYASFDASNKNDFQFNLGAATYNSPAPPGYLLLTPSTGGQAGSVFLNKSISLQGSNGFKASFSTRFSFQMTEVGGGADVDGYGADGIVFVINSVSSNVGSYGGGIGYSGIQKSVGIEFDTWKNSEYADIDGNHIGIDLNGNIQSVQQASYPTRFNNGNQYFSWVDFNGDTQSLEVRIATNSTRPSAPFMSRTVDLVSILGTPNVYVGFTSATGGSYERHMVNSWSFTNQYAPIAVCGNGLIELGENCDGGSCCTANCTFATSSTVCRASTGACDAAETCTGSSSTCPSDSFASANTTCRASTGPCDVAEKCTGSSTSCPADSYASSSVVCRPSAGPCDTAESCSGTSVSCPTDSFASSSTVCRAANGTCDVAETCTGSSASCPADAYSSSSVMCRPATGICDQAEFCTGTGRSCPADQFSNSSVVCRSVNGTCDVAETCTGSSSSCPSDSFAPNNTVCRKSIGPGDTTEMCTGSSPSCPPDVSGSFETPCDGFALNLNGQTYSWLDYDVISFHGFVANTGDIEGRAAIRHNAQVGSGWSVGYQIHSPATPYDNTLPFSMIVGDNFTFPSGAVYPDGSNSPYTGAKENMFVGDKFTGASYLVDRVQGSCGSSVGCLDSQFEAARQCYGMVQAQLSNKADNVVSNIQWSGLTVTCNSRSDTTYYMTLTPQQMSQYTYVMFDGCSTTARWIISIAGTSDVTFTGASFPAPAGSIVYNILGSGRTVNVHDTNLNGHLLAPFNDLRQTSGVINGKVIVNDITMSLQLNRGINFTPQ